MVWSNTAFFVQGSLTPTGGVGTFDLTVTRAAGQALVAAGSGRNPSGAVGSISSIVWDPAGDNQTLSMVIATTPDANSVFGVYILPAPTSAKTGILRMTFSTTASINANLLARAVSGGDAAALLRAGSVSSTGIAFNASTPIRDTVPSAVGDLVMDFLYYDIAPGNGLVVASGQNDSRIDGATATIFGSSTKPGASSVIMGWDQLTNPPAYANSHIVISLMAAADTTAPILTSPTGTSTGATTGSGTVTTDEANGTLYFLATTNSTETATTVKASATTQAITTTGSKSVSFTGLTASTVYYAHYVHRDAAGNDSTVANSASFTTATPDTIAPVLTSPTGTQTGGTTASGTVVTDEANGTLYSLATTNATESAATVKATGATQTITTTGTKTVTATGLTAATIYYLHYVHRDAAGNDSTVANSASFTTTASDTTAPILSSPTATTTGSTTASGSVSTDEANGTLYRLASINATETASTVKTAALTTTVTATGVQSITFSGLTSGTQYYAHYVHRDAAGNDSAVSNSAAFTTTGVTITYTVAGKNIMGGKRLGVAHHVTVHDKTTRALIATKTGLTSDATTGLVTFTHASIIAGTEYLIMPISDADVKDTGFFWATAT